MALTASRRDLLHFGWATLGVSAVAGELVSERALAQGRPVSNASKEELLEVVPVV
jgi:hypothetical protein